MFKYCKSSKVFLISLFITATVLLNGCRKVSSVNSANIELKESVLIAENIGILDVSVFSDEKNKKNFVIQIDSVSGLLEAKAGTEFDVMNEYGFLAKAKLTGKDKDGFWKAEIIAENIRSNLLQLCQTRMLEREKECPNIPAFRVFPSDSTRSKINLGNKIDISEQANNYRATVYKSLPKAVQEFGNSDANGIKGNLELIDNWSDFNGDEKIDFVVINGKCNADKAEICSKKLILQNNKWLEIPTNK